MREKTLILASSSPFRKQQLLQLGLTFDTCPPDIDETPLPKEAAPDVAKRLAEAKARATASRLSQPAVVIGSDQVALCAQKQLGKPGTPEKAAAMLAYTSGKTLSFYTALAVFNCETGSLQLHMEETRVTMRPLSPDQIARYLTREPDAVRCAGAAKSEGLGASLIARIDGSDPNALIGLPLFALTEFLNNEGFLLP